MMPVLVCGLMWLLVVSLLVLRRGRAERSILYAAVTIAVATTLDVDAVYVWVDRLWGGTNLATLLSDLALMVGIFFLGRAVAKAADYTARAVPAALGPVFLGVALAGTTAAFFLIDRGATTTTFMLDLGAQPAAAAYSMIQFTYDAVVIATMSVVAARQVSRTRGAERWAALSLLAGSASGIALWAVIVGMDVAHLTGNLALMRTLGAVYGVLFVGTFVFLCVGLAGQPAVRRVRARRRAHRTRELIIRVTPVWRRAIAVRPGLSQVGEAGMDPADAEAQLHREIVEIRDAVIDPRVGFTLTTAELALLDEAEAQLTGGAVGEGLGRAGGAAA